MAVYVDDMNAQFGQMIMCHMIADTTDELLAMADRIGVQRKWLQDAGTHREHFDISKGKASLAVAAGAKRVSMRDIARLCRLKRAVMAERRIGPWPRSFDRRKR